MNDELRALIDSPAVAWRERGRLKAAIESALNGRASMNANDKQVGGSHYKTGGEEHWDRQYRLFGPGYFIGCITKYVERFQKKNGYQDLLKAQHFLEKLIELEGLKPKDRLSGITDVMRGANGTNASDLDEINQRIYDYMRNVDPNDPAEQKRAHEAVLKFREGFK